MSKKPYSQLYEGSFKNIVFFNPNLANYATMADHWVACEQVIEGSEWHKVEFDYQASEDFEYAYIGFMGDFSTSTYSVPNDDYLLGYYVWIDEVIVTRIDPQLTITEDISICPGETVTLEATSNFPVLWEDNNSSVNSREVSPLQDYRLTIFDRWGGTIFTSKNSSEFWNGDTPGGDKADIGVYTYLLEYNYAGIDTEQQLSGKESGDIILIR